jgi:2-polyprenyl-3-methyl-5-hydroxy-6-metoxy-1,4-benzoquinol methylase
MIDIWRSEELVPRERCPICAAPPGKIVARRIDALNLRDCPDCKALFVDPVPNERALARCYGPDYFREKQPGRDSGAYRHYSFIGPNKNYEFSNSEVLAGHVPGYTEITTNFALSGKAILEIGCATGALLQSLAKYRPARLVGIDIAREQIAFGKANYLEVELYCGTLETIAFHPAEFDIILLLDVLEHVQDPSLLLDQVNRLLKPNGSIFIHTPNGDAFDRAKANWSYLFWGLEHVVYLRTITLARIVKRVGLSIRKLWSVGTPGAVPFPYWSEHRLVRLFRNPLIVAANRFYRSSRKRFEQSGYGLDLSAVVAR